MTAVVRLEQSPSPADSMGVVALREWGCSPPDDQLMRVFAEWVQRMTEALAPGEQETLPAVRTLEEVRMTLIERVSQWPAQWMQEGLEQGLEHERALLRRQAALRFGAAAAERLSAALAHIADPERLAEVGDWLVRCDTGEEFLARVGAGMSERDPRRNGD